MLPRKIERQVLGPDDRHSGECLDRRAALDQVFVMGEAERPGSCTVSGLSTMTNALFASGGVRRSGRCARIRLGLRGTLVPRSSTCHDMLLRGDTSGDERLLPGDVHFHPADRPDGQTASGEVRGPQSMS